MHFYSKVDEKINMSEMFFSTPKFKVQIIFKFAKKSFNLCHPFTSSRTSHLYTRKPIFLFQELEEIIKAKFLIGSQKAKVYFDTEFSSNVLH
jgi:hypothetical protein